MIMTWTTHEHITKNQSWLIKIGLISIYNIPIIISQLSLITIDRTFSVP